MNNRKYQWNFNHVGLFRQLTLTYFLSVSSASKTIRERILQKPELFFLKRDLTGPSGSVRHFSTESVDLVLDELINYELIRRGRK